MVDMLSQPFRPLWGHLSLGAQSQAGNTVRSAGFHNSYRALFLPDAHTSGRHTPRCAWESLWPLLSTSLPASKQTLFVLDDLGEQYAVSFH